MAQPTFEVRVSKTVLKIFFVPAETKEQAEQIVWEKLQEFDEFNEEIEWADASGYKIKAHSIYGGSILQPKG